MPSSSRKPVDTSAMQFFYLSPEQARGLSEYKYNSSDKSVITPIFKKYFWTFLIDQVIPITLAPNLITLIGFIPLNLLALSLIFIDPSLTNGENLPRFIWFLAAIAMFFYQTMDCIDGMQARKTGSSSPLGQLFDHGLDSLNCFVGAIILSSAMMLNSVHPIYYLIVLVCGCTSFFFATAEEYFTHCLRLPLINGPMEGILLIISLFLTTGIFGPAFWYTPINSISKPLYAFIHSDFVVRLIYLVVPTSYSSSIDPFLHSITILDVFIITTLAMTLSTLFTNVIEVFKKGTIENQSFISVAFEFIKISFPFCYMISTFCYWVLSSQELFEKQPFIIFVIIGGNCSQLAMRAMVFRLCNAIPPFFHHSMLVATMVLYNNVIAPKPLVDEEISLYGALIITILTSIYFFFALIWDMSTFLKIKIFTIEPRLEKNKKTQ